MEGKSLSIAIPSDLAERIDRRVRRTDFDSVEEYAVYVLDETMFEIEQKNPETVNEAYEDRDQQEVEQRLRSLGYLSRE